MSTATHKHRAAFALALRTISPSLSALHASRLRLIPTDERERSLGLERPQAPPLTPLTCVQCGHASVRVRVVRLRTAKGKGKQKPRIITDRNTDREKGMGRERERESSKNVTDISNAGKETPPRVLERTCVTCDFVERTPVPRGAAALFQSNSSSSARKARQLAASRSGEAGTISRAGDDAGGVTSSLVSAGSPGTTPRPGTAPTGAHAPLHIPPVQSLSPVPDPHPKKRLKKRPGLQELLERNRLRQVAAARGKAAGGLSSFLDGL